jgi:hypothetical protein
MILKTFRPITNKALSEIVKVHQQWFFAAFSKADLIYNAFYYKIEKVITFI